MSATITNHQKYRVPSVESACRILRAVCESGKSLSMSKINQISETSATSTLRIVSSFCSQGFLRREEDGRIAPGKVLMALGSRLQGNFDLRMRAVAVLTKLAKTTGETAHLVMPMETHCYLQEVIDSPQLVRVASRPGTLIDYHCSATGKCLLAFDAERLASLRHALQLNFHTVSTITDWSSLEANLAEVRKRGFAIDDEEYHDGVRCVAAPVFNASNRIVAAIGVTGTISSLTKSRVASVSKNVMDAANELAFEA